VQDIREVAAAFHRACERADVGYVFVGGMAVNAWGQPRTTSDLDALAIIVPAVVDRFVEALARERLTAHASDFQASFKDAAHVTVHCPTPDLHVDIKFARTSSERAQVRHGVSITISTGPIRVARPEETIAFKLHYGSPQDLQDARSILVRQEGRLDEARLAELAFELGVDQVLDQMRAEIRSVG